MEARGEGVIHAKGRDIPLLFTTRALLNAEKQLGKSIPSILRGFVSNTSGYTELVALLRVGMEAARVEAHADGQPISNSDVIAIIDEVGYITANNPVMEALAFASSYIPDKEDAAVEGDSDPN